MQLDDFLQQVASEPERCITREVRGVYPEVIKQLGGLLLLQDLQSWPGVSRQKDLHYRHIVGPPASPQVVSELNAKLRRPLPRDLEALLTRVNGIHLWANEATGRAYTGIAPVEEWELMRTKLYGDTPAPSTLDDRYLAISYHCDGAEFVVIDLESGMYFLMDTIGLDTEFPIGESVEELLDWLWDERREPKP